MATSITAQQLEQIRSVASSGDVPAAWKALSDIGDRYATSAYQGISQPFSGYGAMIRATWTVTGADMSKFAI